MNSSAPLRGLAVAAMAAALLLSGCTSDDAATPGTAPGKATAPIEPPKTGNPISGSSAEAEPILQDNGYISLAEYNKDPKKYKKAVLFFTAANCEPCKKMDEQLSTKKLPEGLIVVGALIEDSKDLAQKYAVTKPATYVLVDQDGKELKKWQDSTTIDEINTQAK